MDVLLPEWSPRRALVLRWPTRNDIWPYQAQAAQAATLTLLSSLAPLMAARDIQLQLEVVPEPTERFAALRQQLPSSIDMVPSGYADIWIRDCAPFYLGDPTSGDASATIVTDFNGWAGLDTDFQYDIQARTELCRRFQLNPQHLPIVLEGGSLHTNGQGLIVYVASSVLDRRRNPELTTAEFESVLREYFAAKTIIRLPQGLQSDETGGHADNLLAFLSPTQCVLSMPASGHIDYAQAVSYQRMLEQAGMDVMPVAQPALNLSAEEADSIVRREGVMSREAGMPLTASYTNGIRIADIYVVPQFGVPEDAQVLAQLRARCPDLTLVPAPARDILVGGGGWHCASHAVV
ncbi:MAG: hypothetical protein C0463_02430 [Idiomarina sp.]|nr:hypothetical protein [Idiomarina sp.]